jgi:hypothetical protein
LPPETYVYEGEVATRIRSYPQLIGHPLLACASITYINHEENHLQAALLLNAVHPGAKPPDLPEMEPLAGHPGLFEAPGSGGEIVARRIPGAWLVVQEVDEIGLTVPLEILKHLHARV